MCGAYWHDLEVSIECVEAHWHDLEVSIECAEGLLA